MSIETAYLNIENQDGVILEKNFLGSGKINLNRYKELAVESLATEKLKERGGSLTLKDIKSRNKEMYEDLEKEAGLEYLRNIRNPILGGKEKMFDLIKKSQTDQVDTQFIADMKTRLKAKSKSVDSIDFYSSLGTNVDFCGVDGIFTFTVGGQKFDVAIDVTKKPLSEKRKDIADKLANHGKYYGDVILSFDGHDNNYVSDRDATELIPDMANQVFAGLKEVVNRHNEKIDRRNNKN